MTEEFEEMIEEVEDEVVEDSQSSADPINTEEVVEEDELIVTDEMLDTIADTAIAALQDILQYFNVGEVTIDEYEGDEGELILDISGKDMAVLIGRHGKTLDALQFIVSMITVPLASVIRLLSMLRATRTASARNSSRLRTALLIVLLLSTAKLDCAR